jgi:hypothetical protein
MRSLQKQPQRVASYFKHRKIAYAAWIERYFNAGLIYTEPSLTADKNNTLKPGQKLSGYLLIIRPTAKAVLGAHTHV